VGFALEDSEVLLTDKNQSGLSSASSEKVKLALWVQNFLVIFFD
jgi:hypothetical protein